MSANHSDPEHDGAFTEKRAVEDFEVSPHGHNGPVHDVAIMNVDYEGKPTEEEMETLRRVPGGVPTVAYFLCAVEFCERASYYGCANIWANYINRGLPTGGNGWGAVKPGTNDIQGALDMGETRANATSQSFNMLAYCLPLIVGYLADTRFGRFNMIFWGVIVCGVGHVLIVVGGSKDLIASGTAKIPFFIGVYILAIGAAMFKPNVTPLLLDQMKSHVPIVKTLKTGERVIEDPEHSTERVMLWFYLLINIGGFMSTATSYSAKFVGWWLAFLLPLILYMPLPFLLLWLKPRLHLHKPGGSDLPNVFRVLGHCLARGGVFRIGRRGWWRAGLPSVLAERGITESHYNDAFVEDVKRTFQATGMFLFFPAQFINDNGLGNAANYLGTMLLNTGVPNDVMSNFNSLSIIIMGPILNYGLYPTLRKAKIHYGPVARITTGLFIATLAGLGYTLITWQAYKLSPCGKYGSSADACTKASPPKYAPISLWYEAIPYFLGGFSELFVNVPAYGIAYSRAPINMRGVVSAINLFCTGISYIINLIASPVIKDPHLMWDFAGPTIAGAIVTVVFYFTFKHIDKEEYVLSTNQVSEATGTRDYIEENDLNHTENRPPSIAENEMTGFSQKI